MKSFRWYKNNWYKKLNLTNKIFFWLTIISVIIGLVFGIVGLFNNYTSVQPAFDFSNILIRTLKSDNTTVAWYKHEDQINLENTSKPSFYIQIHNDSNGSVNYTINRSVFKLSNGFSSTPTTNVTGLAPAKSWFYFGYVDTITTSYLLDELAKDSNLKFIFEIDMTYSFENTPQNKFLLKKKITCVQGEKNILPTLLLACNVTALN